MKEQALLIIGSVILAQHRVHEFTWR